MTDLPEQALANLKNLAKEKRLAKADKDARPHNTKKYAPRGAYAPPNKPLVPVKPGTTLQEFYEGTGIKGSPKRFMPWRVILPDNHMAWQYEVPKKTLKKYVNNNRQYEKDKALYDTAVIDYENPSSPVWEYYNEQMKVYQEKLDKYQQRCRARDERRAAKMQAAEQRAERRAERRKQKEAAKNSKKNWYISYSPWDSRFGEFKALTDDELKTIGGGNTPEYKYITDSLTGKKYKVYDSQLGVPLGFTAMMGYSGPSKSVTENGIVSTDYAIKAFDGSTPFVEQEGCGHILNLKYNAAMQILQVDFKGASVCYYRVPSTVAGELIHFAKTKEEINSPVRSNERRHLLGIRFWDLVRIRGTFSGSKYRFEYMSKDDTLGIRTGRPTEKEWDWLLPDKQEATGHIDSLQSMLEAYRAEHDGTDPDPSEYADMVSKARLNNGYVGNISSVNANTPEDAANKLFKAMLTPMHKEKATRHDRDRVGYSEADIDDWFEMYYNKSLANKNVDRSRLQKLFDEWNNMDKVIDPNAMATALQKAGALI